MLNISRTWFGLNLDNKHRVIIRDGVEYVREAASARETFDVIFLDACTMDQNAPVNCPSIRFLHRDVAESFHALLGHTGILVMHVMTPNPKYLVAVSKAVSKAYTSVFQQLGVNEKEPVASCHKICSFSA
ncbi:unnamed protein product [Cylicostephanus goldi]|uniref:PABS domain-containing protein n=1 Tax=Cylicostephanus goldi TaxID=71465 RepID=A0A3P7M1P0_CYLGO|nr:unnamed protein product [Cylicostephanus goldi]